AAATWSIQRQSPSGNVAGVRGAVGVPRTAATAIVRDFEVPFDLDLVYTATSYDSSGAPISSATATARVECDACPAWLTDLARRTNSLPLVIESMEQLVFEAAVGVHRVLNRRAPVMTSLPTWTPNTELLVLTDTLEQRDQLRALLGSGYPFLV